MIKGTYINPFGKEYEFEIENGVITHTNLGDYEDKFYEEIAKCFMK